MGGITVTIEEGITSIGANMFYNCTGLTTVKYKNTDYSSSASFQTAFETDGGTIAANVFTGSGF